MYVTPWMLGFEGWYGKDGYSDILFFVPFHQFFLLGPVIYFYSRSALVPDRLFRKNELLHFIPAVLYLIYSLYVFVMDFFVYDEYVFYADGRDKDLDPWYQILGLAFVLGYLLWSIRFYLNYRKQIVQVVSFADTLRFLWIRRFLVSLLLLVGLRLLFFVLYPEWGSFVQKWWYYFFVACIFYYVAMEGMLHAVKLHASLQFSDFRLSIPEDLEETSKIEIQDLDKWKDSIQSFLETERVHTNPNLTLDDLAKSLETTPRQISQVVNQGFDMNFNDYINKMRVDSIISLFKENKQQQFTLLSLALDCGFNSKTTFNRSFKKFTGKTPRDYLNSFE